MGPALFPSAVLAMDFTLLAFCLDPAAVTTFAAPVVQLGPLAPLDVEQPLPQSLSELTSLSGASESASEPGRSR